jgi:hypothetical protein
MYRVKNAFDRVKIYGLSTRKSQDLTLVSRYAFDDFDHFVVFVCR